MKPGKFIGRQVREYRIFELIGQGGMAAVYKAEHVTLKTIRAIKVIREELSSHPRFIERFKQEARMLVHLTHPNLVQIYDFFEEDGHLFLVMMYVPGESLSNYLLRKIILQPKQAIPIIIQALNGLGEAHRSGIIHRDISPDNIMLMPGRDGTHRAVIIDFGIAKAAADSEVNKTLLLGYTMTGSFTGKVTYCSPEQAQGQEVDERSDIYSMGLVLHQCLTGQTPFKQSNPVESLAIRINQEPPLLSDARPEVKFSENLEAIVLKALMRKPENRFQSAADFREELESLQSRDMLRNTGLLEELIQRKKFRSQQTVLNASVPVIKKRSRLIRWGSNFLALMGILGLVILAYTAGRNPEKIQDSVEVVNEMLPGVFQLPVPTETPLPSGTPAPTPSPEPSRIPSATSTPTPKPPPVKPAIRNTPTPTPEPTPTQRKAPPGFVYIPAGIFMMGTEPENTGRYSDERLHPVMIKRPIYMGETEVTQQMWVSLLHRNPSFFQEPTRPVETVSWHDAVIFCNRLSRSQGLTPCYYSDGLFRYVFDGLPPVASGDVYWKQSANGYRLPTEAEWEFACRAGTDTAFSTGQNLTTNQANYDGNKPYMHFSRGLFRSRTTPVKTFPPNPWGLYDMHGNVWEWCWDFKGEYPSTQVVDPSGPIAGTVRVRRGGSWVSQAADCRSARRASGEVGARNALGFRIVRNATQN